MGCFHSFHFTDQCTGMIRTLVCKHFFTTLHIIIAGRKATTVIDIHQPICMIFDPFFIHMPVYVFICDLRICMNCCGYVLRLLHSSFDLKGINPCLNQLWQIRKCTHILHAECIFMIKLSAVICLSTWLRTASTIAASSACKAAHQTFSGIAEAHRTMHKCFNLNINRFFN